MTEGAQQPAGVQVFGSALVRVSPDLASLSFAVIRKAAHPREAFSAVKAAAAEVTRFLREAAVTDAQSSRVTLEEVTRYVDGERRFDGYRARIGFNAMIGELDRLEGIITGVVDAGANKIEGLTFQTSSLKALRARARRAAVQAAREKAQLYAEAAGVTLGAVVAIEDVDPGSLRRRGEGHVSGDPIDAEALSEGALDPGAITVAGAVRLRFSLRA